ncbi:MAG: hypothetical protein R3245_08920, partial [Kiloniellales bacterium]|nr:hypothetical protein [Kiloniellales bacterium]
DFGTNLYSPTTLSSATGMTLSAPQGHAVGLAHQTKAWMRRKGPKGGGFEEVRLTRESNPQGTTAYVVSGTRDGTPLSIRIEVRPKVKPGYYAPLPHDMKKSLSELKQEMDELSARHEDKIEATYKNMDPAELSPTPEQVLALRARTAMRSFRNQLKQFERQNRDLQRKIDKLRASGVPTRAQHEEIEVAEGQIMRNRERLILYLDVVRAYHHLNG